MATRAAAQARTWPLPRYHCQMASTGSVGALLVLSSVAGALQSLDVTTIFMDQVAQQYSVNTYKVPGDGGAAANGSVQLRNATPSIPCPSSDPQCRWSLGTGTHSPDGSTLAVFAMGSLFPAAGQILEIDRATGAVTRGWAVAAYLYGLEHAGSAGAEAGCNYVSVAVQGSIESAPFIACIATPPGGTAKIRALGQPISPEFNLVTSGTFGSHIFDSSSLTYHVAVESRLSSAIVSASVVGSPEQGTTLTRFNASNAQWDPSSNCTGREPSSNPVVQLLRYEPAIATAADGTAVGGPPRRLGGTVFGIASGGCSMEVVSTPPCTLCPTVDRRRDLYYAAFTLGGSGAAAPPPAVKQLQDLPGLKAGMPGDAAGMTGLGLGRETKSLDAKRGGAHVAVGLFVDASPTPGKLVVATIDLGAEGEDTLRLHPWQLPQGGDVATFDVI